MFSFCRFIDFDTFFGFETENSLWLTDSFQDRFFKFGFTVILIWNKGLCVLKEGSEMDCLTLI